MVRIKRSRDCLFPSFHLVWRSRPNPRSAIFGDDATGDVSAENGRARIGSAIDNGSAYARLAFTRIPAIPGSMDPISMLFSTPGLFILFVLLCFLYIYYR